MDRIESLEEFEPGSHMVSFSEWIVGRVATLEAERSLVGVGVVRARAVAAEVDMNGLEKDLENTLLFFHIHQAAHEVLLQF